MWRICHIVTADKLRLYISNTAWKLLSFKKNYLNSKINVNIYLRLVINSKDWCDKEQRQSTSFFFFLFLNFWTYTKKFDIADIHTMLVSKLFGYFFADVPHHKGLKSKIYWQKWTQKKRRKKEGESSEVTKQKVLLSDHWDKIYEISDLQHLYDSFSFSSVR